jgi:hypothetical protein
MKNIMFYKDNNVNQSLCGVCIPGLNGVEDPTKSCGINEYCSDESTCIPLINHVLYNQSCNFDIGLMYTTVSSSCGPLKCIQHVCLICDDGEVDYSDGKVCIFNQWYLGISLI